MVNMTNSISNFKAPISGNALQSWYFQRLTSMAMLISIIGILVPCFYLLWQTRDLFAVIQASNQYIWIQIMREIFIICACWHGWLGMRNIIMDYVKCNRIKVALKLLLMIYLLGLVIYSLYAIWL